MGFSPRNEPRAFRPFIGKYRELNHWGDCRLRNSLHQLRPFTPLSSSQGFGVGPVFSTRSTFGSARWPRAGPLLAIRPTHFGAKVLITRQNHAVYCASSAGYAVSFASRGFRLPLRANSSGCASSCKQVTWVADQLRPAKSLPPRIWPGCRALYKSVQYVEYWRSGHSHYERVGRPYGLEWRTWRPAGPNICSSSCVGPFHLNHRRVITVSPPGKKRGGPGFFNGKRSKGFSRLFWRLLLHHFEMTSSPGNGGKTWTPSTGRNRIVNLVLGFIRALESTVTLPCPRGVNHKL